MAPRTHWLRAALGCAAVGLAASGSAQPKFVTGQDAELMVSGIGFNNAGGPLLFHHPTGIASDGTRFALCDRFNNRVLVWNSLPDAWNDAPDFVLGQPDFTANDPGTSKSQMNWPGNVSIGAGGVLAVTDTENDRILVWTTFPTSSGQPADIALNLPSYTEPGGQPLQWPWGVWTDGTRLAAVATMGGAVLFWNTLPTADNAPPSYRVAIPQFGTPRNISTDGSTYFFVGDHNAKIGAGMSGTFFWNSFPTVEDQPYDFFFDEWIKGTKLPGGQLAAGGLRTLKLWNSVPTSDQDPNLTVTPTGYDNGDGVDVVSAGGRIYVNNYNGNNVQVYNSLPTSPTSQPDFALGCPTPSGNTLADLNYIQNPVLSTDGTRLVATSDFDRTLWIWNELPTTSGEAPDIKISLVPWDLAPWASAMHNGMLVAGGRQKVAMWNSLPLAGQAPDTVFSNSIGTAALTEVRGVALDSRFLYVADKTSGVHVWSGIPATSSTSPLRTLTFGGGEPDHIHSDGTYLCVAIQSNPVSILVYRVDDIQNQASPSPMLNISAPALGLNLPSDAMTFGTSLAIANMSGNSVIVWDKVADWGDPSKAIVLGQDTLGIGEAAIGRDSLFMPNALMYDGGNLWVGERKFSSRIVKFAPLAGGGSAATGWAAYD